MASSSRIEGFLIEAGARMLKRSGDNIIGCCRRRHGHTSKGSVSSTYSAWKNMKGRCLSETHRDFHRYGGRGITVCKRWLKFENFLSDMGERPVGMELDRKDNEKGYSKANCRWTTHREQSLNRRTNRRLTWKGRTQAVIEWAEELGLNPRTIYVRLHRGWSVRDALRTPSKFARSR